ncbi:MAG: phasin family protein [Pacificimonas sp.]|nr:phasin family protein [Pacificimonas sp.]
MTKETKTMAEKKNPTETMQAQAETAMNQSKAAMEDMAAKTKDYMEKQVISMEEMGDLARGNVEAMVEAGKIFAEGSQSIARETSDFVKAQAEDAAATMKAMSGVKNPNEVVELQGKFVRGQFDAMVAQTSTVTEHMLKLTTDVMAPFQNRMATAMSKVSKAA